MISEELASLLDIKLFGQLLKEFDQVSNTNNYDSLPLKRELISTMESTRLEYVNILTEARVFDLAIDLCHSVPSLSSKLLEVQCTEIIPFYEEANMACTTLSMILSFPSDKFTRLENEVIKISNLIQRNEQFNSIERVADFVMELKKKQEKENSLIIQKTLTILQTYINTVKKVTKAHEILARIHSTVLKMSSEYITAFSEYSTKISHSLLLKMQIIQLDLRKVILNDPFIMGIIACTPRIRELAVMALEAIELGKTNLLLYQQMGVEINEIAKEYRHLKSQTRLVKEDISELEQKLQKITKS